MPYHQPSLCKAKTSCPRPSSCPARANACGPAVSSSSSFSSSSYSCPPATWEGSEDRGLARRSEVAVLVLPPAAACALGLLMSSSLSAFFNSLRMLSCVPRILHLCLHQGPWASHPPCPVSLSACPIHPRPSSRRRHLLAAGWGARSVVGQAW
ncbi:hypothetical protein JOL62DRAFT_573888, partial [Phyllosticta paracitricarpa]